MPGTYQLILTVSSAVNLLGCVIRGGSWLASVWPCRMFIENACGAPMQDVMMPEVDGLEVLKYVRANEVLKDLPVVSKWLYVTQLVLQRELTQQAASPVCTCKIARHIIILIMEYAFLQ